MYLGKRVKAVGGSALFLVLGVTRASSKAEHPNSHRCLMLAMGFSLPENKLITVFLVLLHLNSWFATVLFLQNNLEV